MCVYFSGVQMGDLVWTHLDCFLDPNGLSFLGWSPLHVSAGARAVACSPGASFCVVFCFQQANPRLVHMAVPEFQERQKHKPNEEHAANLCLSLIGCHLVCQSQSHGQAQSQYEKEIPDGTDTGMLEQIGGHYCNSLAHCHIRFFIPSQLF